MGKDAVRAYYAAFGEREWQRLTTPDDGAVEFAVTKQLLARYLPPSGCILDLGGGLGRFTIWLTELTLLDGLRMGMGLSQLKLARSLHSMACRC